MQRERERERESERERDRDRDRETERQREDDESETVRKYEQVLFHLILLRQTDRQVDRHRLGEIERKERKEKRH